MSGPGGHQLGTRLSIGTLLVGALAGLLYLDAVHRFHWGLGILLSLGVPLALAEFYALVQRMGHRPLRGLGIVLGTALTVLHWWWLQTDQRRFDPEPPMVLLLLACTLTGLMMRPHTERKVEDLALTLLAVLYLWFPLSFAMRLRVSPAWGGPTGLGGQAALVFALAAGKGSDIGAYFVGSRVGRHPLAPILSPKKTWEGLGGAFLGGALFGWGVRYLWPDVPATEMQAAVLGGILGLAGQTADLWESFLKRAAGAKDSGRLLPAFGGILDLVDSLVLVLPATYYGLLVCGRTA